jgi:hypothetical protein
LTSQTLKSTQNALHDVILDDADMLDKFSDGTASIRDSADLIRIQAEFLKDQNDVQAAELAELKAEVFSMVVRSSWASH